MVPLTDYLQLPAPCTTSINSGSQQLGLCNQGVLKSDTTVEEAELLADVGSWLKESTCTTVPSSEQVRAASTAGQQKSRARLIGVGVVYLVGVNGGNLSGLGLGVEVGARAKARVGVSL